MRKFEVTFSPMVGAAWKVIQGLPKGLHWTVEDLMRMHPELISPDAAQPARSLGKCMTTLLKHGRVKVVGRARIPGDSKGCNLYQRNPQKCWVAPGPTATRKIHREQPEPKSPVTKSKTADGVTHVRFGMGWKPAHPERDTRALRGYRSSLCSEYLG